MNITELLESVGLSPGGLSLWVIAVLTIVQISPIKVNPWSWLGKKVGQAINSEVVEKVDNLEKHITEFENKMKGMEEKEDERAAVNSRVRILRFNNELQEGRLHTKDGFDQVLSDITDYEAYCNSHPSFKNSQTSATVEYIKKNYAERLEKHDFL